MNGVMGVRNCSRRPPSTPNSASCCQCCSTSARAQMALIWDLLDFRR